MNGRRKSELPLQMIAHLSMFDRHPPVAQSSPLRANIQCTEHLGLILPIGRPNADNGTSIRQCSTFSRERNVKANFTVAKEELLFQHGWLSVTDIAKAVQSLIDQALALTTLCLSLRFYNNKKNREGLLSEKQGFTGKMENILAICKLRVEQQITIALRVHSGTY